MSLTCMVQSDLLIHLLFESMFQVASTLLIYVENFNMIDISGFARTCPTVY